MTNLEKQERFIKKAKNKYGDKYDYSKVNYIDSKTPICITCPKHGDFFIMPTSFLNGNCNGCPKCIREEIFIKKAREIHNDKYDYSKVKYSDANTPVCIICPEHGEFYQTPNHHLYSRIGCPECVKNSVSSKEVFVKKSNLKYNNKFDYSKVDYIDSKTKVCIICPEHGEFWQTPCQHLSIIYGCPECAKKIVEEKSLHYATDDFIKKAKAVHGNKYDYSKTEYINRRKKVCIICPSHGEFWQDPNSHLNGHNCPECVKENIKNEQLLKKENFIKKAREIYGNRFDYTEINVVKSSKGIPIFDNEKQVWFLQTPKEHLKGNGYADSNILAWCKTNNNFYFYYYNIAKQYEDLYDLYKDHKKIFYTMKKNNLLKDYTWLKNNNERKIKSSLVYAYEFSDHSVYVGLTNSLNRRDKQHRERTYRSNGKLKYDGVLSYSEENNIEIPKVKILIENLTKDESGEEEKKWIRYYKDNGWNVINKNKGGATGFFVTNKSKWTKESVIEEAKKYKNMEELYRKNKSAYCFMCKYNLKKDCFPNAKLQIHNPNRTYTKELIEETIKKCPKKVDLRNMDMAMYIYLHQHNLIYVYYPKERNGESFLKK